MHKTVMLALGTLVATPVLGFNALQNPGFESGALSPWYNARNNGGIIPWDVTDYFPHSGRYDAWGEGNWELRQDITPTPVSEITEVSFWIRHPDQVPEETACDLFYSDNTVYELPYYTTDDTWTHLDVSSQLLAGKTLIAFSVWGHVGGQTQITYFDDALINVVPEPGLCVVTGTGLAALLLRRRR